jgi:hypothetical protein
MYHVEMAIELQRAARLPRRETNDNGRRRGMASLRALDRETIRAEQIGQHVGNGPSFARSARDGHEPGRGIDQSPPIHGSAQALGQVDEVLHGRPL